MEFAEWVSAMSFREVLDVVLSYLKVILSWPGVLLIALVIFRKRIAGLIERVKSLAPTKVSFYDVRDTVADARSAEEAATSRLKEASSPEQDGARGSASQTQTTDLSRPGATEAGGEANAAEDASVDFDLFEARAKQKELRKRFLENLDADIASSGGGSQKGRQPSGLSVNLVNTAWRRLERASQDAARVLGLDTKSVGSVLKRSGWGPVELFDALYVEGRGSREAVRAVHKARRLRDDLNNGVAVDEDEAEALANAIEDLSSTARKLAAIKNGQRFVREFLENFPGATLP